MRSLSHPRAWPSVAMIDAERCRRDLRVYVEQAWPILEPGTRFVPGFHLDAIAEHLQAISRGQIRRLLINIPPRHMKSLAVSVFWPTWEWIDAPHRRWLFASYAQHLSTRDSLKCRRLIESPWYRERWGHVYRLTSDQNVKQRFENNRTGVRLATSVGGTLTGEGGDRIVVDDPHNVSDADSDAKRTNALRWWDQSMATRLNDPETGAFVIVMQRVHQSDLAGHVLEQGGFEHLCLPAEYDGRKSVTVCGWRDPRTEAGQLLWPERISREAITALKRQLGTYGTAGQLQQRPVPAGGGMFKREWFRVIDALPWKVTRRCRFWDCAATHGGGDWTVGVKVARTPDDHYVVEHVVRGQWSPAEVQKIMRQTADLDGTTVRIREEQEPGSAGKVVIADRTKLLAGFDYEGCPATGEKTTRWRPFAAQAEAGNVSILCGEWNNTWLDELCAAPYGKHDDQVDASAGAFGDVALRKESTVRVVPLLGL